MEQARSAVVEVAVKKYRSLTPILCKVGVPVHERMESEGGCDCA
jgi:hypothetical protein